VIGDNFVLEVHGIGSTLIHCKVIENMLYVSQLKLNLLFIIQVTRKGYSFEFTSNSWSIKKGLATLVNESIKNNLYIVD